jgi:cellulose synthase/poly-beta-1,6-N-acetylglucosamine synthase-like glycosyltransferase
MLNNIDFATTISRARRRLFGAEKTGLFGVMCCSWLQLANECIIMFSSSKCCAGNVVGQLFLHREKALSWRTICFSVESVHRVVSIRFNRILPHWWSVFAGLGTRCKTYVKDADVTPKGFLLLTYTITFSFEIST